MHIRRPIAARRALLAAALATTSAANAFAPVSESFSFDEGPAVMGSCGTFDILVDGTGSVRLTTYFDGLGNPIRVTMHGLAFGTLTNSASGFFLVDAPSVANVSVDLVAGIETHVGSYFNVTLPGVGKVYFDVGRIVYDGSGLPVFVAGQQHAPAETLALLCAALR